MARYCGILLTLFRVVQLALSLHLLAIGAFITYQMLSLSAAANDLEQSLISLQDDATRQRLEQSLGPSNQTTTAVDDFATSVSVLNAFLVPILKIFQGVPTTSIIVTVVGFWSVSFTIYLFFAHRAGRDSPFNRRLLRVTLEFLTFIMWIVCTVCTVSLAFEYAFFGLAGGIPTRVAFKVARSLIIKAIEAANKQNRLVEALSIVDKLGTIGLLTFISTFAAGICTTVSLVSFLVAICTKGKEKSKHQIHWGPDGGTFEPYVTLHPEHPPGYGVIKTLSPTEKSPHVTMTPVSPYRRICYDDIHSGNNAQQPYPAPPPPRY